VPREENCMADEHCDRVLDEMLETRNQIAKVAPPLEKSKTIHIGIGLSLVLGYLPY
jgi:hypothetical protein